MTAQPAEALAQQTDEDTDLLALYQEIILDHVKNQRHPGRIEHADCCSDGRNPLCGDKVHVTATVDDSGTITEIRTDARGCAISIASASIMAEALTGTPRDAVEGLFRTVQGLLNARGADPVDPAALPPENAVLAPLSGVARFPARVKCATLPWQTLLACLSGTKDETTTE